MKKKYIQSFAYWFLIATAFFCIYASSCESRHVQGNVPRIIYDYFATKGCKPIESFYQSYTVRWPPYLFINDGLDFVAVCESVESDEEYKLLIKVSNDKNMKSCTDELILPDKPGEIKISKKNIEGKDNFVKYGTKEQIDLRKNIFTPTIVIEIGEGGFIEFVCVNGDWLYNTYS
jgi:hypothetical protein